VNGPPLTLTDLETLAGAALDPHWREYFAGGAGDERTLRGNIESFARMHLRQRVLCGIEEVSTAVTVLGHELALPVVVAPVAYQRMAHPEGEEGMARAAAAAGAAVCLSTFATARPAEVAAAAPGAVRFLQVYVFRDHGITGELIAQALDAGFSAIFLTVDIPVLGSRDRERRIEWTFPEESLPAIGYALERGAGHDGLDMLDPALDWAYLERLCASVPAPVVVKGVLEPEDAVLAAEHGAAGIVVSNHGGRQLDGAAATIDALPAIVEAVGDRLEVLLDGGVRRGTDIAVALALGARAVLAGRTPLWGLATGGEAGARAVLELLRDELAVALHLTGCRSVAELGAKHVVAMS
jgi:isopentenyl diphosphate isomerase/L-lactate dehydrogenase-like FMN-dependent dehydrogenase